MISYGLGSLLNVDKSDCSRGSYICNKGPSFLEDLLKGIEKELFGVVVLGKDPINPIPAINSNSMGVALRMRLIEGVHIIRKLR